MHFGYTGAQVEFRREVNAWLDAHIPPDDELPADVYESDDETHVLAVALRAKLAAKGWLHPSYEKKYGGGELNNEELEVLTDVFGRRRMPMLCDNSWLTGAALFAVGTAAQQERWLPLIGRGEIITWQCYTESESGTDLASVQCRATVQPDGSFVINGGKIYGGHNRPVDYLLVLAVTDPEAARHHNLSLLMVPADALGLNWEPLTDICLFRHNVIHFDDVPVAADNVIGVVHQGWAAAQASLAGERGGFYSLQPYQLFEDLIDYCKENYRGGRRLADDPHVRHVLADLYMELRIGRLLFWRSFWKGGQGIPFGYEGLQNNLLYKEFLPLAARATLDILGPAGTVTSPKWQVLAGKMDFLQRYGLQTHGGGTPEALKITIARMVGLPGTRRPK